MPDRQARLSLRLRGRAAARLRLRLGLRLRHRLRMRGLRGRMRRVRLRHLLLQRLRWPSFCSQMRLLIVHNHEEHDGPRHPAPREAPQSRGVWLRSAGRSARGWGWHGRQPRGRPGARAAARTVAATARGAAMA